MCIAQHQNFMIEVSKHLPFVNYAPRAYNMDCQSLLGWRQRSRPTYKIRHDIWFVHPPRLQEICTKLQQLPSIKSLVLVMNCYEAMNPRHTVLYQYWVGENVLPRIPGRSREALSTAGMVELTGHDSDMDVMGALCGKANMW